MDERTKDIADADNVLLGVTIYDSDGFPVLSQATGEELLAEDLIGTPKEVLVIPARHAWPLYVEYGIHAYICKADRAFQRVTHVAFYEQNQIQHLVPLILEQHDRVVFEQGRNTGRLGQLVNQALEKSVLPDWPYPWSIHKVLLLSAPDAVETVKLERPIINDLTSNGGPRIAFARNQRYVSLEALRKAKKTSQLEEP
jgi:hypothetical protein